MTVLPELLELHNRENCHGSNMEVCLHTGSCLMKGNSSTCLSVRYYQYKIHIGATSSVQTYLADKRGQLDTLWYNMRVYLLNLMSAQRISSITEISQKRKIVLL